jgi:uncharacterized protein GlcG (DUF336 family)
MHGYVFGEWRRILLTKSTLDWQGLSNQGFAKASSARRKVRLLTIVAKFSKAFQSRMSRSFWERAPAKWAGSANARVQWSLDDVVASRGGIPLIEDGKIIGTIGCSGGTGSQDGAICTTGATLVDK